MWKGTKVWSTEMPKTNVWSGDKDELIHHDKVLRFKKFEKVQTVFLHFQSFAVAHKMTMWMNPGVMR
jgi:hypothetical protein